MSEHLYKVVINFEDVGIPEHISYLLAENQEDADKLAEKVARFLTGESRIMQGCESYTLDVFPTNRIFIWDGVEEEEDEGRIVEIPIGDFHGKIVLINNKPED